MPKRLALVLLALGLGAESAAALDVVNLRATNGPLGTKRADQKYLPGDILYLTFDIQDLQLDVFGALQYQTTMEILDEDNTSKLKEQTPPQKLVLLGGKQLRSNAFAVLGTGLDKGKYKVKLTVLDIKAKQEKTTFYDFEVLPKKFGIVQP